MIRHIPNFFTLLNLTSGMLGIITVLQGNHEKAIYFVLIGGFFDFVDGLVARLLKVESPLGRQLDSLADMVTFGVLPALFLYQQTSLLPEWSGYLALMIAVFAAIRLAIFNTDDTQSHGFRGLPTPANAILITTIFFLDYPFISTSYFAIGLTFLSSFLQVSPIPMLALKFKSFGFNENKAKYFLIILLITGFLIHWWTFLPLVIPIYIIVSIVSNIAGKK